MGRPLKRRVALLVMLAALLAGGAVAAMAATSSGTHRRAGAHRGAHLGVAPDIVTAAGYLGVPPARLARELRAGSGHTLAQIAVASGRTEAGLIAAIVAARRARLAAGADRLESRVTSEVRRAHFGSDVGALRAYLGVTPARLRALRVPGTTLAKIADSLPGKSAAGLTAALVAAGEARLERALSAGTLTGAEAAKRRAALTSRVTRRVDRPLRAPRHTG